MSIISAEVQSVILATKFVPPQLHSGLIERPELVSQLENGLNNHRLTLLSAPAGFGKTSLAVQWLKQQQNQPVAWLSLDTGENDLWRFWHYLMTACQELWPGKSFTALELLADRMLSLQDILTVFLNELAALPAHGVLILEDLHRVKTPEIHHSLSYLIDHLPRNLHLLCITRVDPPLPLSRWRASGDLYDLPAANLRFSPAQTQEFLGQNLLITLPAEAVDRLQARTEGWPGGLRLAMLAVQGRSVGEIVKFLSNFTGEYPPLLEYLSTEILQAQPAIIQELLLKTSFLGRVNGSLAEAITGSGASGVMLEQLEYANLFLTRLDGNGKWYRYQELFAEALRYQARQRLGESGLRELASQASRWCLQNGLPDEAIEIAITMQDFKGAADLLEEFFKPARFVLDIPRVRSWFERLPENAWQDRPALSFNYAILLLFSSDRFHPATRLQVEIPLQLAEKRWMTEENWPKLGEIMALRSCINLFQGDYTGAYECVCKALEWLPKEEILWRGIALTNMVPHELYDGRLNSALFLLREAHRLCVASDNPYSKRAALFLLADVYMQRLDLEQARQLYHEIFEDAANDPSDRCVTLFCLAQVFFEQNEFEQAKLYAEQALELNREVSDEWLQFRASLLLIRLKNLQGEPDQAEKLTQMLVARTQRWPLLLREVQAYQAQLSIRRGELKLARHWSAMLDSQPAEGPRTLQERESLVQARLLIAQKYYGKALNLLEGWLAEAQAQGRSVSECEIWSLKAMAHFAGGDYAQAAQDLNGALDLAQPENYRRLFLEEGQPMAELLQAVLPGIKKENLAAFVRSLLHDFTHFNSTPVNRPALPPAMQMTLREPLSRQEQRVLRLLSEGLSNSQIAQELVVSINTVKSQVKSIYRKLDINSRKEARQAALQVGTA